MQRVPESRIQSRDSNARDEECRRSGREAGDSVIGQNRDERVIKRNANGKSPRRLGPGLASAHPVIFSPISEPPSFFSLSFVGWLASLLLGREFDGSVVDVNATSEF